ncbi:hypothetical protein [Rhodococcus sp. IEGM 1408]|uniref:hypothetical protein n=1 Tax=Rhodococcus sp. IEGM 1408 TaxID=3082220 RepID=UPI002952E1DD|nr:hypothetical protein [Rhodococcus sp. IEGM 1408]MDV8000068.1 hypothetical protein [Rhodococcus sp. IEGM 1408]
MDSTHEQFERFAPLLAREGVDVSTATADQLEAAMVRARQRQAAAVAHVRAVLEAHARGETSTAGGLLEDLERSAEDIPAPLPDALTVASRFAQLCQSIAPELPSAVIDVVREAASGPDAPEGMARLCAATLLDLDAAGGLKSVARRHGIASALYAAAAMTSGTFRAWATQTGTPMAELVSSHA